MLPQFVIIGAQKAGSTFIHEALRQHPDLFLPRYETPAFEDPFYDRHQVSAILQEVLAPARPEQIAGIKRPDYLGRPECPKRLARHLPGVRLLAILRNPMARAVSAYYWYVQVGILPARPLNEGLAELLDGAAARQNPKAQEILSYGLYYQHLRRYLRFFAREQMLLLLDEDLRTDVSAALQRAFEFLGVDASYMPANLDRRPKQSVYALPRLRWLAWANRHFFYDHWVEANNMQVLAQKQNQLARLAYGGTVAIDRVVLRRLFSQNSPAVDRALSQALAAFYQEDILALESFLQRDLSKWKETAK